MSYAVPVPISRRSRWVVALSGLPGGTASGQAKVERVNDRPNP